MPDAGAKKRGEGFKRLLIYLNNLRRDRTRDSKPRRSHLQTATELIGLNESGLALVSRHDALEQVNAWAVIRDELFERNY